MNKTLSIYDQVYNIRELVDKLLVDQGIDPAEVDMEDKLGLGGEIVEVRYTNNELPTAELF